MKISVSLPSQKTRRDEGGYSRYVLLETPRGKGGGRGAEVADAASFAEAVENERNPRRKDMEEEVSRRQYTMEELELARECEEALFRGIVVLENWFRRRRRCCARRGKPCGRAMLEWRSIKANEQRETDVVRRNGIIWIREFQGGDLSL